MSDDGELQGDLGPEADVRERALLHEWANGDSRSGDRLIQRYFDSIRAYFIRRAPDEYEELVQDTFVRLSKSCANFRGECTVRVFIYAIARNVLREHLRKLDRTPEFEAEADSLSDAYGRRPSSLLAEHERYRVLLDALQDIDSRNQDVIELRYWGELSGPELRDLFGLAEGTVRSQIRSGLQQLRKRFNELSEQPRERISEDELERRLLELRDRVHQRLIPL